MFAFCADVFVDPVQVGFAFREAAQEILARHAGIADADLHHHTFLHADHRNDVTQVLDQQIEQLGRKLELHDLVCQISL